MYLRKLPNNIIASTKGVTEGGVNSQRLALADPALQAEAALHANPALQANRALRAVAVDFSHQGGGMSSTPMSALLWEWWVNWEWLALADPATRAVSVHFTWQGVDWRVGGVSRSFPTLPPRQHAVTAGWVPSTDKHGWWSMLPAPDIHLLVFASVEPHRHRQLGNLPRHTGTIYDK